MSELNAKKNFINVLCSHFIHEPYFYFVYKTVSTCDMLGKTIVILFHVRKKTLIPSSLFVCLFSWHYNPLWLYFYSLVAGFSLLVFEVS